MNYIRRRALQLAFLSFASAGSVATSSAVHADVLDCTTAVELAENVHSVGDAPFLQNNWRLSWTDPRILEANGAVRKEGYQSNLRGDVHPGDRIEATIQLFDLRPPGKRTRPSPQTSYKFRWVAPRPVTDDKGRVSRCSDELSDTIEAGTMTHQSIPIFEAGLADLNGDWYFLAYDLKGKPFARMSYTLAAAKSQSEKAREELEVSFRSYMFLDKCLALSMAPLTKDEYRTAVRLLDKAARQNGIDTEAAWESAASAAQAKLDSWDRDIARSTGLNWETRQAMRKTCAIFSGGLMEAAKEASGTKATPKKDF